MAIKINVLPLNSNTDPNNETTALQTHSFKTESVEISELASALQKIREDMPQELEIDMNKVNAYRKSIARGTYVIDADCIAQKLLKLDDFSKRK